MMVEVCVGNGGCVCRGWIVYVGMVEVCVGMVEVCRGWWRCV